MFSISLRISPHQFPVEFRINYNRLGDVIPFIDKNPTNRYNIIISNSYTLDDKFLSQLEWLRQRDINYTIETPSIASLLEFLDLDLNAYLKYPATDWEQFNSLIQLGVTDVLVDGPLAFNYKALKSSGIRIRLTPTNSINASLQVPIRRESSFYIRPEDISLYNKDFIIDLRANNREKEETLYKFYSKGEFGFAINQLIPGLPQINNLLLPIDFGEQRLNCEAACASPLESKRRKCTYCQNAFKAARLLEESTK